MKLKILVIAVVLLIVLAQFFRIDTKSGEADRQNDYLTIVQPSQSIAKLVKSACYDCHSNETVYPWYAKVAPVSWLVGSHIKEGREHFNFSEWNTYPSEDQKGIEEECAKEIEGGEMPLKSYVLVHSEAKLSERDKLYLINWFNRPANSSRGEIEQ